MNWRRARNAKRDAARARERAKFALEMRLVHDAPEDSELAPFDCVMLEQSIRSHGNEPPAWIVSASRAWLAANDLSPSDLKSRAGE
jgi:hypothetical protein